MIEFYYPKEFYDIFGNKILKLFDILSYNRAVYIFYGEGKV